MTDRHKNTRNNPNHEGESRGPSSERSGGKRLLAYQWVANELRSSLSSGEFSEDRALPTEADLGASFGVSRQTIRRAFQELVSEGLVYRVAGRGTFASKAPRDGRYLRSVGTVEDLEAWTGSAMEITNPVQLEHDAEMSARLELDSSVVATVRLRRLKDGVPFGLTRVYLSPKLGGALTDSGLLAERGLGTVIGMLQRLSLTNVSEAEQVISAVPTPEDVAEELGGTAGEPCLKVERTYIDTSGIPVEVAVTHYNPARYDYRISIRRHAGR